MDCRRPAGTGYARYIGRVGALAVALGVAGAITTPGLAWADDSSSNVSAGTSGSDAAPSSNTQESAGPSPATPAPDPTANPTETGSGRDVSRSPKTPRTGGSRVVVRSSGGALTSRIRAAETDTSGSAQVADPVATGPQADDGVATTEEPGAPPAAIEDVVAEDIPPGGGEDAGTPVEALSTDPPTPTPTPPNTADNTGGGHDLTAAAAELPTAPTALADPSTEASDDDEPSQSPQDTARTALVASATAPATSSSTARAPFSLPQLPTPAEVFSQVKQTVTKVLTQCACTIFNSVQGLLKGFQSTTAAPTTPSEPAQATLAWTVAAWVRRQVDFAVTAFNRSPVGQLVQYGTARIGELFSDISNSPIGRQFSARVTRFLVECSASTALPAEFDRTVVVSGLREPTDFAILTDPDHPEQIHRIFITEKSGALKSYDPETGLTTTLVSVPVETAGGERGLIGIEVDPNFWSQGQDGYHTIYVAYTSAANYDQLSSFTLNQTLDGATETVLVTSDRPAGEFHHGGELAFDPQGQYLYWAIGNNKDNATSQDLSTIHGKILRLNRDGSAPEDNPFVEEPGADPRVWAYGFRNPFRFTFTPDGKLLAGDVGEAKWEELNVVTKGANYGWPGAEGPCSGCETVNPLYAYLHTSDTAGAGSITSVVVYTGDTYPDEYANRVFIADYSLGWIKVLTFDSQYTSLISEQTFDSGAGAVVKLDQGPDGNLYQLNIYPGTISVIAPSGGNRAPTAVIDAPVTSGAGSSLEVQFSAANSTDPDDRDLTYRWNFGDGRTSTELNPTVVFTNTSTYTAYNVTLTVSDGDKESVATQRIVVGSTPPDAVITVDKNRYNAGDTISFSAIGTDAEDPTLPASAYSWTVEFHHADHMHPFLDNIAGPTGTVTIPRNADQLANTYYRVILNVTDSSGLTTSRSVDVNPNLVSLTFGSSDPDARYTIDGIPHQGSHSEFAVVGVERTLSAPSTQYVGGQQLVFAGWSDGGAPSHTIITPGTDTQYLVTFTAVPSPAALPSTAAVLT